MKCSGFLVAKDALHGGLFKEVEVSANSTSATGRASGSRLGLGLFQELEAFAKVLDSPVKPVCAILGGAKARACRLSSLSSSGTGADLCKVTDKIQLIKNMLDKVSAVHRSSCGTRDLEAPCGRIAASGGCHDHRRRHGLHLHQGPISGGGSELRGAVHSSADESLLRSGGPARHEHRQLPLRRGAARRSAFELNSFCCAAAPLRALQEGAKIVPEIMEKAKAKGVEPRRQGSFRVSGPSCSSFL